MNWLILFLVVAVVFMLSQTGLQNITVFPDSSCATFEHAANAILLRPDLDTLDIKERAEMCKIPAFMIKNSDRCPDYDWSVAKTKMKCDTSTEQGSLTTKGVTVRV